MKSRKILEAERDMGCKFDDLHYYLEVFDKKSEFLIKKIRIKSVPQQVLQRIYQIPSDDFFESGEVTDVELPFLKPYFLEGAEAIDFDKHHYELGHSLEPYDWSPIRWARTFDLVDAVVEMENGIIRARRIAGAYAAMYITHPNIHFAAFMAFLAKEEGYVQALAREQRKPLLARMITSYQTALFTDIYSVLLFNQKYDAETLKIAAPARRPRVADNLLHGVLQLSEGEYEASYQALVMYAQQQLLSDEYRERCFKQWLPQDTDPSQFSYRGLNEIQWQANFQEKPLQQLLSRDWLAFQKNAQQFYDFLKKEPKKVMNALEALVEDAKTT